MENTIRAILRLAVKFAQLYEVVRRLGASALWVITAFRRVFGTRAPLPPPPNLSVQRTVQPTTPISFSARRYAKATPDFSRSDFLVAAGHPSSVIISPEGWKHMAHPEGQPYFYHAGRRIVTETNIFSTDVRREVEETHDLLVTKAQRLGATSLASVEWFIEVEITGGEPRYYVVDHQAHTMLWLTDVHSDTLALEPVYSEGHMALQRKFHYWAHVEFFPMHVPMHVGYPVDVEQDVYSVLNHAVLDGATCHTSTSAYSPRECERFVRTLQGFKLRDGYKLCALARIWKDILNNRFIHLHGQQPARLHRLARMEHETTPTPPLLSKLFLGTVFFNAPQGHIDSLDKIYVDKIVYNQHWKSFIEERLREWNAVTLVATVLWTANVGLLQVMVGPTTRTSTLIRGLVVLSTFCAMTSTVVSLLHDRQHRRRVKEDGTWEASVYLDRHWDPKRGFLYLAMLHSLPYVLLLWAYLLAAAATFIYGMTAGGGVVVIPVALLLVATVIITVLRWNIDETKLAHLGWTMQASFRSWKNTYMLLLGSATRLWRWSPPRDEIAGPDENDVRESQTLPL